MTTTTFLAIAATVALTAYGAAGVIALLRVVRGPTSQDRILALDLIYAIAVLSLLVLGILFGSTIYFDAALVIALFGFVGSSAMAKFLLRGEVIE